MRKTPTKLFALATPVKHGIQGEKDTYTCKAWVETSTYSDGIVFGYEAHCGWYISDLLEGNAERIAIDFGQNWYVTNLQELAAEIEAWLCEGLPTR